MEKISPLPRTIWGLIAATIALILAGIIVFRLISPGIAKPSLLYTYAANDVGDDFLPSIAYGNGKWIVVWQSNDNLKKNKKNNYDILFVSSKNGESWNTPKVLYKDPKLDVGNDKEPYIATDGNKNWFVVWSSSADINSKINEDYDILGVRSLDNGKTWKDLSAVNTNADSDSPGWCPYGCTPKNKEDDSHPRVATNGKFWRVVWRGESRVLNIAQSGCFDHTLPPVIYTQHTDDIKDLPNVYWSGPYCRGESENANPAIAGDGQGNWVLCFVSDRPFDPGTIPSKNTGTDLDIYFARTNDKTWAYISHPWTDYDCLCNHAFTDNHHDILPAVTVHGSTWMVVWSSAIPTLKVDGKTKNLGLDYDILVSISKDKGKTWTDPRPVNNNADSDKGKDRFAAIATNGSDWVVVWQSDENLNGKIGSDEDILVATSKDGKTWTNPKPLHKNADKDMGADLLPQIATDGKKWVVVWHSDEDGGSELDFDILVANFVLPLP